MNGVSVIDADGHVLETDAELENISKAPTKATNAPVYFPSSPRYGWPRGFVRGLEKINRTGADNWIEFIEGIEDRCRRALSHRRPFSRLDPGSRLGLRRRPDV